MIALAMAAALASAQPTDQDLTCAAIAWQGLGSAKDDAPRDTRGQLAYMFFLGRLTAKAPQTDWPPLIATESTKFLAIPPRGSAPGFLPCETVIKQIVSLPEEATR